MLVLHCSEEKNTLYTRKCIYCSGQIHYVVLQNVFVLHYSGQIFHVPGNCICTAFTVDEARYIHASYHIHKQAIVTL